VSQYYAIVVVFRSAPQRAAEVLATLAPVLSSGTDAAAAPLPTALAGSWSWIDGAALCAAVWKVAANRVHGDEAAGVALIDRYLETALTKLDPVFAYFSIFEAHGERDWLQQVFEQLAAGDWDAVLKPAYERMLLPPHMGLHYLEHPSWTVLADEAAGTLVRTRGL